MVDGSNRSREMDHRLYIQVLTGFLTMTNLGNQFKYWPLSKRSQLLCVERLGMTHWDFFRNQTVSMHGRFMDMKEQTHMSSVSSHFATRTLRGFWSPGSRSSSYFSSLEQNMVPSMWCWFDRLWRMQELQGHIGFHPNYKEGSGEPMGGHCM
jgi:hypothetical protein